MVGFNVSSEKCSEGFCKSYNPEGTGQALCTNLQDGFLFTS
jgi:hypothetical protein